MLTKKADLAQALSAPDTHDTIRQEVERLITLYRTRFHIPSRWVFDIEIMCPDEFPMMQGSMSWGYLPNAQFRMRIRCDLDQATLEWVVAHELLEALLSNYGEFTTVLINRMRGAEVKRFLGEQHADIRNEIIEWLLLIILGMSRP